MKHDENPEEPLRINPDRDLTAIEANQIPQGQDRIQCLNAQALKLANPAVY